MKKELRIWVNNPVEERSQLKEMASIADQRYMRFQNNDILYRLPVVGIERFAKSIALKGLPFEVDAKLNVFENGELKGVWEYDGKLSFENDDFIKKLFIIYLSRKNKRWAHLELEAAVQSLFEIDKAETLFNLSVMETSHSVDIVSIMRLIENRIKDVEKLHNIAKYFKLYLLFIGHQAESIELISSHSEEFANKDLASNTYRKLSKQSLIDYAHFEVDTQYKIIPILLFIGVGIGRKDNKLDEVRTLKKEDIVENGIHVGGENPRFIEIDDEDLMYYVNQAKKRGMAGKNVKPEIANSPFLLNSQSNYSDLRRTFGLSHQGYRFRLVRVMDNINDLLDFDEEITPRHIIRAGMIYYVKKFMEKGATFEDAIFMTLKRFGDLKQDAEMQDPRSINLRNNFKSFWEEVYSNGDSR